MDMSKKRNPLAVRVPDPFDSSARTRLIRMGLSDKDGKIDHEVMSIFAGVFAGLFFDDLCEYHDDTHDLLAIYETFQKLYKRQDYQHMYLLLSIQYDYIRKPLPDPVWWLAGDNNAVKEFMTLFMARYEHLMSDAGITRQEKEADKK